MNNTYRADVAQRNRQKGSYSPGVIPRFTNDKERLEWIKQQADQVSAREVEGFHRRLAAAKRDSKKR